MKSILNILKNKLVKSRGKSSWQEINLKSDFPTMPEERKNYILKIDIELLESKIKRNFQDLGQLAYKEAIKGLKKNPLKKRSAKYKLVSNINELKKEIDLKKSQIKKNHS